MRKLKLLLAACALMVGWPISTNAYTTDNLISAGWTQVTDFSSLTLSDNYFVLIDAGTSNYAMTCTGTDRIAYQTLADPTTACGEVWIVEQTGENYAFKSIVNDRYFSSGSHGWDPSASESMTNADFELTQNDGKYSLHRSTGYAGPWNNDGNVQINSDIGYEDIAVNKAEDQAPGFYIYTIARTVYNSARVNAATLKSKGWALVTSSSLVNVAGNQYVLIDANANDQAYVLTHTDQFRPAYTALTIGEGSQQWFISAKGDGYSLQNKGSSKYLNATNEGWNTYFSDAIEDNSEFTFTLAGNKWTLQAAKRTEADNYIGRWRGSHDMPYQRELVAGNKGTDYARPFYIYAIPTSINEAEALPASGDMVADKWYFYDNILAGEYSMTATSLDDIVYGTLENDVLTNKFSAVAELTAQRYYIKSASAQKLTITSYTYAYHVGDATSSIVEGGCLQNFPGKAERV